MSSRSAPVAIVCLSVTVVGACGSKHDPVRVPCAKLDIGDITYANTAGTIIKNHCTPCHSSTAANRFGALPSVNFDDYARAEPYAERIAERAFVIGNMPPSTALQDAGVQPLDETQRCLIKAWADQGSRP